MSQATWGGMLGGGGGEAGRLRRERGRRGGGGAGTAWGRQGEERRQGSIPCLPWRESRDWGRGGGA